jgi:hypothetical protein
MAAHADPVLDQFQLDGSEQNHAIHSTRNVGQTFTVGTAGFLNSIELSLFDIGQGGDLVVTILDMRGGDLSLAPSLGSVSISGNVPIRSPDILSAAFVNATLIDLSSLIIPVITGDVLAIDLSTSRELPDLYAVRTASFSDLYAGGAIFIGTTFFGGDMAFKTFITSSPEPGLDAPRPGAVPAAILVTRNLAILTLVSNVLNDPSLACEFASPIEILAAANGIFPPIHSIGFVESDGSLTVDRQELLDALDDKRSQFVVFNTACGSNFGVFGAKGFRAMISGLPLFESLKINTVYTP